MQKIKILFTLLIAALFFSFDAECAPLKKVYITPGLWGQLFAVESPLFNRDGCLDVLCQLREKARLQGYEILQADSLENLSDFEYLVLFEIFPEQLPQLARYPKEKLILFLWEPPSVLPENYNVENHYPFSKIYTWKDDLIDGKKYFKFYYPVMKPMIEDLVPFHQKEFSTLIACNKASNYPGELYSQRRYLIHFFEIIAPHHFSLFGKWWPQALQTYRGPIEKKCDVLKHFRFCFAYENIQHIPGYVTEKIFDCFQAGVVPIYWGAPNISSTIPKNCYIPREEFADNASLLYHLENMDETTYNLYLKNIRNYLGSERAKLYSKEHFISLFIEAIKR